MAFIKATQSPAGLRIDAIADAQQSLDIIAHRLRRERLKILVTEQIEDLIQLSNKVLGGTPPPFPTLEPHVSYHSEHLFGVKH